MTLKTNKIYPRDGLVSGASGGIIQVKQTVDTTASQAVTSTSYVDAGGLNVTITPQSASNKILIMATTNIQAFISASEINGALKLLRGSTDIIEYPYAFTMEAGASGNSRIFYNTNHTTTFLDSPATTSATTYKIQLKIYTSANSAKLTYNQNSSKSTILAMEVCG